MNFKALLKNYNYDEYKNNKNKLLTKKFVGYKKEEK